MAGSFPWLPVGHGLPGGTTIGRVVSEGAGYQVVLSGDGGRAVLLVDDGTAAARRLADRAGDRVARAAFLDRRFIALIAPARARPFRVADLPMRARPLSPPEAGTLLNALSAMAEEHPEALWSEAVFAPDVPVCLPTVEGAPEDRKALAVRLLTGGVGDTDLAPDRIRSFNPSLAEPDIRTFLEGFGVVGAASEQPTETRTAGQNAFRLPGRPDLAAFFQEYIIDPNRQHARYAAMKVEPPGGVLLHGPPGSGKTFAVRRLAAHLGWSVFEVDMGAVGSPYIHQTAIRLKALFRQAVEKAPSIVVIDEVDAVAGPRGTSPHSHVVEEVSELLKLVESAAHGRVVVIATTNRIDAIDPAFLRKGRFDHVLEVGYAGKEDVLAALEALTAERPCASGLGLTTAAARLAGRPLSDVAWVVNEAARLAAKSSKDAIDDICLFGAISRLG